MELSLLATLWRHFLSLEDPYRFSVLARLLPFEADLIIKTMVIVPVFLAVNYVFDAALECFDPRLNKNLIWELQRKQEMVNLIWRVRACQAICVLGVNFRNCIPMIKREPANN
jgi:hypothetical protein